MKTNERFLESLKYMDAEMRKDKSAGKPWRYTNVKKRYSRFEDARKHNRLTNCVSGVQMGLLMAGLPSACTHWYGAGGKIVFTSNEGREAVKKHFDVKTVNATVNSLYKDNKLCDGDILIYQNMNHTNCYYGGAKSFDSGHAYCKGNGELAVFNKWIGNLAVKTAKVGCILRLKDRAHYRVQAGAFSDINKYNEHVEMMRKKGFATSMLIEDGLYKVQAGSFSGRTNAEKLVSLLAKKSIPSFIKEV